mmetsp:Transcript_36723/g.84503  ORF Transcript_36723/g.84503 Transcript_36723/m.84503 type:complete len:288 (-) Transcript_36723:153-1016(-)
MGGGLCRPKVLVQPHDETLHFTEDDLSTFAQAVSQWLGRLAITFSSWTNIKTLIERDQHGLLRALQQTKLHNPHSAVEEVKVILVQGSCGDELDEMGWFSLFSTSYVEVTYDRFGNEKSVKAMNANGNHGLPPRPSKERLGIVQQIAAIRKKAEEDGNSVLLDMDDVVTAHHRNPPHGSIRWTSETVLMQVTVGQRRSLVLQLTGLKCPAGSSAWRFVGTTLAGREIASSTSDPSRTTVAELRTELARQVLVGTPTLELVLPDGSLLDESKDTTLMLSFLPSLGTGA